MAAQRCWDCNNTFHSNAGGPYCNVCHQARKTRQHNERQARQDQWAAEQAQRENARVQAQRTQALINAENARISAINRQTQVIMESTIRPKDAYDRGFKYVDSEFKYGNPAELELEIDEAGTLGWQCKYLYVTTELNSQFRNGLSAKLNQNENIYSTIKASATQAGRQNANGTLQDYFNLHTGLNIGGVDIKTKGFKSHFTSTIDEENGELKMNWNKPFTSSDLNQAYKDGVNEVYWAENTDEKKNYRLKFEVPNLKAAREYTKGIKRLNAVFKILRYVLPLFVLYIIWQALSGWTFLFSLIGVFLFYGGLEHLHEQWQVKNNDHLR